MIRNAIVRTPCRAIRDGLTTSSLGKPVFETALIQHSAYVEALRNSGVRIRLLESNERFPDSVFVEDVAVCSGTFAVIARPGAVPRREETGGMKEVLSEFFAGIEEIKFPGTLDGGDVLMAGDHFYIGITGRTNRSGADQLIAILEKYGMTGSTLIVGNLLHLKSGISYLGGNTVLVSRELKHRKEFAGFEKIEVAAGESYAANSLLVNGRVLVPSGYPDTVGKLKRAGFETLELDVSEFRKVDGGLSCLSLRF